MPGAPDAPGPDPSLPDRLFATDRFPRKRLNIYSKPDFLFQLRRVLSNSPELDWLKKSCFGALFNLPARQTPVSCKLIHSLLSRQLVGNQKYTLWSVVGGHPFRFSIAEFEYITGLPCGPLPQGYVPPNFKVRYPARDSYWKTLIGGDSLTNIADLGDMLEKDPNMPYDRRLRIALIIIVDGVLIAHKQVPRPTLKYVQMVLNLPTSPELV